MDDMKALRPVSVDLTGLNAYVTGGSRGIAAALVKALAASGARTAFCYSQAADAAAGHPNAADLLCADCAALGAEPVRIEADLSGPRAAQIAADRAIAALGRVDIAVLSASIQIHKPFLDMPEDDVDRQLRINIKANVETIQQLLPPMRARGFGRIISIGSVQELAPSAEMPIYALTKGALENLVRNLAVENAAYGVTINNIAPGLVETDRNAFRRKDMDAWHRLARAANPMGRAGRPDDIVGAALFLASDSAAFVTGATIYVTGGAHIARGVNDILARAATDARAAE